MIRNILISGCRQLGNINRNEIVNNLNRFKFQSGFNRGMGIMKRKYGMEATPSEHQLKILEDKEKIQKAERMKEQKPKFRRVVRNYNITAPDENEMATSMNEPEKVESPRKLNVAVIGAPNAGKSTLVNAIVGEKVCAVSPIEHTTRDTILGIYTRDNTQLVFHDTPGIIKNFNRLSSIKEFVNMAWGVVKEADMVMLVVDATGHNHQDNSFILDRLSTEMMDLLEEVKRHGDAAGKDFVLVINKVDLVRKKDDLIQLISTLNESNIFSDTFVVSATNHVKLDSLVDFLVEKSVDGEWQFESSLKTDQTDIFRASEIIKEKLYSTLHHEIPYTVVQNMVGWTNFKNGDLRIDHDFIVGKDIHKKFIIGEGGKNIKAIYRLSKQALESVFNRKVHLFLTVKSKKSVDPSMS